MPAAAVSKGFEGFPAEELDSAFAILHGGNTFSAPPRCPMCESFLKLRTVIARTALSRSEIYRRVNSGSFPRPIKLGIRAIAWQSSQVNQWIAGRIEASK